MKKTLQTGLAAILILGTLTGCSSPGLLKSYEDTALTNKSLIINIEDDQEYPFFSEDIAVFPKSSSVHVDESKKKESSDSETEPEESKESKESKETSKNTDDEKETESNNDDEKESTESEIFDSKAGLLAGVDTRADLFNKNIYERLYPASTTKIMTALLTIENTNFTDVVTFTDDMVVTESGAKLCGFNVGDHITVEQLFYAMLIYSGNDAANALAIHIGGSIEGFAEMMNKRAKELGCVDTHFLNPSGLHDDDHYTSAYDLYLIFNECIKHEQFEDAIRQTSYSMNYTNSAGNPEHAYFDTTNQYFLDIYDYPENVHVIGGKTGTTDEAGCCIILYSKSRVSKEGYISVIFGAKDSSELYSEMNLLLDKVPK